MKKDIKDQFEKELGKLLENFSGEELKNIITNLEGKDMFHEYEKLMEKQYTYQVAPYSTLAKPMPDFMLAMFDAKSPTEAFTAYSEAKTRMQSMTKDEREEATRNFLMNILAKAQNGKIDINEVCQLPLWTAMALVEKFDMKALADTVLEVLTKQSFKFYKCYIDAFEEDCEYIISKICREKLDTLEELMHTAGFLPQAYSIIVNAVVLMAGYDRENRLKYIAWVSRVVASCVEKTLNTDLLDRLIGPIAYVKATELLPMLKMLYGKYKILSIDAPTYRDAENIVRSGYDNGYIQYGSLEEMLETMKENEEASNSQYDSMDDYDNDDFLWDGDDDYFWDDLFMPGQKDVDLFTLKVTLTDAPMEIMRQIEVPSNIRLDALAEILTIAMGWEGCHLNQFKADGKFYEETDEETDAFYKESGWKKLGQHEYSLKDLLNRKGKTIVWEYDFGDSWEHSITLESRRKKSASDDYEVTLLKGKNACPPEDCGGVCGYANLLQVLNDPKSPDYLMMKNWVSPDFNPKKFSKAKVQRAINDYLYDE